MGLKYAVIVFLLSQCSDGVPEALMYFPPLEVRAARTDRPFGNQPFAPTSQSMMMATQNQPVMHMEPGRQQLILDSSLPTVPHQYQPQPPRNQQVYQQPPPRPQEVMHNITYDDIIEGLSKLGDHISDGRPDPRSSEFSPHSIYPHLHGYPQKPYGTYPAVNSYPSPSQRYDSTDVHSSEPATQPKADLLSGLLSPIATKASGKLNGLLGLILSLFGSSTGSSLVTAGFKTIVEGIVKPLLAAKGGLKSLISKLAIPVIGLLLINVEVLITWWWLWEDCGEESHPSYSYQKPVYSPTNSYN